MAVWDDDTDRRCQELIDREYTETTIAQLHVAQRACADLERENRRLKVRLRSARLHRQATAWAHLHAAYSQMTNHPWALCLFVTVGAYLAISVFVGAPLVARAIVGVAGR